MKLLSKKKSGTPRRRSINSDVRSSKASDTFKRNRTFTGTTSNYLDSLNIKSGLESPRAQIHHLAAKRRKIFSIFITVILASIFLWVLIYNFTATVKVTISDANISKSISDKYSNTIQDYLEINPLSRFRFFLDQTALSVYTSNKLPEVELVIPKNMAGIGVTNFTIKMRSPVAGWKINDKQYYVDAKGIPFEQSYFAAPLVQIVDNSGVSLQTGSVSVSRRFLGFVGQVVSLSSNDGLIVAQATLPANTTRELEVKLEGSNLLVKMSIDRPAGEQVEDMNRAVQYFVGQGRLPGYIDVRVSGKAFFK